MTSSTRASLSLVTLSLSDMTPPPGMRIQLVPFGSPARGALLEAVAAAREGDPLAPVTVVVPSNVAGLTLRRWWARALGGVVAIRFVVLGAVASMLGEASLVAAGRRRVDDMVRWAVVAAGMRERGGALAAGADQPASIAAAAGRLAELRRLPVEARAAVVAESALGPLTASVDRLLARGYDEEDLASAAATAVASGDAALRDLGRVIVYLPSPLSAAEIGLVRALVEAGCCSVIVGLTGESAADAAAVALARELASEFAGVGGAATDEVAGDPLPAWRWSGARTILAPDPDLEGRVVAREVLRAVRSGTSPDRVAVLYRLSDPYARVVRHHLGAAGLAVSGAPPTTVAQTVPGRTLLALLDLASTRYSRHAVMAMLAGAPIRDREGRPVPVGAWEVFARDANVVNGPERWGRRLAALDAKRGAAGASDLALFVAALAEDVEAAAAPSSWGHAADACRGLLARYLDVSRLDDEGAGHLRQVEGILTQLATLDAWVPSPGPAGVGSLLALALAVPAGRSGSAPRAVFVGSIGAAVGAVFDLVIVVGMAERRFPPQRADDPLLPDRSRALAPQMGGRRQWRHDERRAFLAVTADAPALLLLAPVADPRAQRPLHPSRWWLEVAGATAGHPVTAASAIAVGADVGVERVESLPSFLDGAPASVEDLILGQLADAVAARRDPRSLDLAGWDRGLRRGLDAVVARRTGGLGAWEGLVGRHASLALDPGDPKSPTALQRWAECPRRYLLENVLRVAETSRPEETIRLHPMEYGILVHAALEVFFRAKAEAGDVGFAWTDDDVEELLDVVRRHCEEAETRGITGLAVPWSLQRRELLQRLQRLLADDLDRRTPDGLLTVSFEVGFGGDEDEIGPVSFETGERTIRFKGRIDRIDASPDGSVVHVLDYKTGQSKPFRVIDDDPVDRGRLLQLPVYALAAREAYPDAKVTAGYWFVTAGDTVDPHRLLPLDERTEARFSEVLDAIADGIEDGIFPGNPGAPDRDSWVNCRRCPYDRVCPTDRDDGWARVVMTAAAEPYRRLEACP